MFYGMQDLLRDLPKILDGEYIDTINSCPDKYIIITSDKFGNYNKKLISTTIHINKHTGKCIILSVKDSNGSIKNLECTTSKLEDLPPIEDYEQYINYEWRISRELLETKRMFNAARFCIMFETTYFKDIDYDTMKAIAILYQTEDIEAIKDLSLDEKIKLTQKTKEATEYYSLDDLHRDLPLLVGNGKIHSIISSYNAFIIVTCDVYDNEKSRQTFVIDKTTGRVLGDKDFKTVYLKCTSKIPNTISDELTIPTEYESYNYRLSKELQKELDEITALKIMLLVEVTEFENVDYDTMKKVALLYNTEDNDRLKGLIYMDLKDKLELIKD